MTKTTLTIQNAGFETTHLSDGKWSEGIPGWHVSSEKSGAAGDYNPTGHDIDENTVEGDNVAWLSSSGGHKSGVKISQTLSETYAAGTVYEMSVDIGDGDYKESDNQPFTLNILAGQTVIGTVSGKTGNIDALKTVSLTSAVDDPSLDGQHITIEIVDPVGSGKGELLVDNVTVNKMAVLDGTVEGTSGDDMIDVAYTGDPEGDMVDNDDAILDGFVGDDDLIEAYGGDDTVLAGNGDDEVYGGSGDDDLTGGSGNDTIFGGTGNDKIVGDGPDGMADPPPEAKTLIWDEVAPDHTELSGTTSYDAGGITVDIGYTAQDEHATATISDEETYVEPGEGFDDDSSLELYGDGGEGGWDNTSTTTLDFSSTSPAYQDEVQNVTFRINDVDLATNAHDTHVDRVTITALDAQGNPVGVQITSETDDQIVDDNQATGDIEHDDGVTPAAQEGSILVSITGPVSSLSIDYDNEKLTDQQVNVSDVTFETIPAAGTGLEGNDVLYGGDGEDYIEGNGGDDTIFGGSDDDTLKGGTGDDVIYGDNGPSGGSAPIGANLIKNGSFEDTTGMDRTGYGFVSESGDIPNWTDSANQEVDVHNDGRGGLDATDGDNWLDLEASPGNNRVGQDVVGVEEDKTYQLTFDAGDSSGKVSSGPDENLVNVYWAGALIDTIDPPQGSFETYTFTVEGGAGNGSNRLEFEGTGQEDNIGASIDKVSLYQLDDGSGADGNDVIHGGDGDDEIYGEGGNDTIFGVNGNDTVYGGVGDDFIDTSGHVQPLPDVEYPGPLGYPADDYPNNDKDLVYGGAGDDTIITGDDDDTVYGGSGNDHISTGFDDDYVEGGAGDDTIIGSEGNDEINGGDGDDTIYGGLPPGPADALNLPDDLDGDGIDSEPGEDLVTTNNNDTLYGGAGDDTIFGADDDDTLYGGTGDDYLDGGVDDDSLFGEEGEDTLTGGQGADEQDGGLGDDLFIVNTAGDGADDVVVGGEDPDSDGDGESDDVDVLDLTGSNVLNIDYADPGVGGGAGDAESGRVFFQDGSTMTFEEIENVIPCFTPGTTIATPRGERLVEELRAGDRIITRDNGIQEIRWVGRKDMTGQQLARNPHLKPILIKAGALGNGLPERDTIVSPNHRVLVASDLTQLYFEEREVLAAAKHLVGSEGVHELDAMQTSYIHFMFDRHEVVLSNGCWTESFQPGDYSLKGLGNSQRNEIFELFPELAGKPGLQGYQSARRALKKHEAKLLVK